VIVFVAVSLERLSGWIQCHGDGYKYSIIIILFLQTITRSNPSAIFTITSWTSIETSYLQAALTTEIVKHANINMKLSLLSVALAALLASAMPAAEPEDVSPLQHIPHYLDSQVTSLSLVAD
jgi:hypothetical protein